jgi:hypothetical protein
MEETPRSETGYGMLAFRRTSGLLAAQGIEQAVIVFSDLLDQLGGLQMHVLDIGVKGVVQPLQVAEPQ